MKSNKLKMSCKRGFTLIELLVVVLIIGVLAAVAVPQYQVAVMKSRLTQALTLAKSVRDAEQVYYVSNAQYTKTLDELDISMPGCTLNETETKGKNTIYYCDNNIKIRMYFNPPYTHSAYIYILGGEGNLFLEYSLQNDTRNCGSDFSMGKKACQTMGGVETGTNAAGTFYALP